MFPKTDVFLFLTGRLDYQSHHRIYFLMKKNHTTLKVTGIYENRRLIAKDPYFR